MYTYVILFYYIMHFVSSFMKSLWYSSEESSLKRREVTFYTYIYKKSLIEWDRCCQTISYTLIKGKRVVTKLNVRSVQSTQIE